jgi:hypothetical protein
MFVTVTLRGKADADLEAAAQEVARQLHEGRRSGSDITGERAFHFQVETEDRYESAVQAAFSAADVMSMSAGMSEEAAEDFLSDNRRVIQDLMVERGNEALETLLGEARG